jgi:hypothetical protein
MEYAGHGFAALTSAPHTRLMLDSTTLLFCATPAEQGCGYIMLMQLLHLAATIHAHAVGSVMCPASCLFSMMIF